MGEKKQRNWRQWTEATLLFSTEEITVHVYAGENGPVNRDKLGDAVERGGRQQPWPWEGMESSAQVEGLLLAGSINKSSILPRRKQSKWGQMQGAG